jgi:hypothetical protein
VLRRLDGDCSCSTDAHYTSSSNITCIAQIWQQLKTIMVAAAAAEICSKRKLLRVTCLASTC